MIIASRFLFASVLALALSASSIQHVVAAECEHTTNLSDCCACMCGHDDCDVIKRLGESPTCQADRVLCHEPEEDHNTSDEDVSKCSKIPITASDTEDCCMCKCGHSQCAVYNPFGEALSCDKVHCYNEEDADDDDAIDESLDDAEGKWVAPIPADTLEAFSHCSHVPIPSESETEECCECACGHSLCAVFKTSNSNKELKCDPSAIHCYDATEYDDDESIDVDEQIEDENLLKANKSLTSEQLIVIIVCVCVAAIATVLAVFVAKNSKEDEGKDPRKEPIEFQVSKTLEESQHSKEDEDSVE